jgi:hypothetical protein
MGIAAGVAAAGVAGAVGSVAAGSIEASGAQSAANTQAATAAQQAAAQSAAGQAAYNLDTSQQGQALGYLSPYNSLGQTAANTLTSDLGYLTTPYQPTVAQLQATPGYQFTLQQGLLSTQNAAAAQGLGVSGAALNAASNYATGLAQNTYAQDASIYQTNQAQIGNLLTGMVANGQNAATTQAGLQQQYNSMEGNALLGQANEAAQTSLAGAQAQAAGTVGAANATGTSLTNATSSLSQSAILNALMRQNTGGSGSW